MKPTTVAKVLAALCLIGCPTARAQFSSGSDGSYGPLIVTSNTTLDLPPDGKFNCTTITVNSGFTLSFRRNLLNTPVYFLATSNVTINGTIDVSGGHGGAVFGAGGVGGPGGFDGGMPANGQSTTAGDGLGPGAGKAASGNGGGGSYGTAPTCNGNGLNGQTYGNTLIVPLIGGSGGGGAQNSSGFGGGGGGGGAILIASDTRISIGSSGNINAFGGFANHSGQGSGGAVRIVAPRVDGSGTINVSASQCYGGNGRIRVDGTNRFALFLNYYGPVTIGKFMQVFPTNSPRLDIIQAAGTNIVEGFPGPVLVQLPVGAPTNQTVLVQARNFTGGVPITVAVTPDAGPSTRYDTQIDMGGGTVAQTNVNVLIPVGTTSRIYVWSR